MQQTEFPGLEHEETGLHSRILVVDDDNIARVAFVKMLEADGYRCDSAENGEQALLLLAEHEFDLVVTDLRMPRMDGLGLLEEIGKLRRRITTIMITGFGDVDVAVQATRLGAYDFIYKPVSRQHPQLAVARAFEHQRLVLLNQRLTRRIAHPPVFGNLIGKSAPMLEVFRIISQVAPTNASVLITGESGAGKEQVARAIHDHSQRRELRFNIVDCTAIPENLMESVLFGHKKGSFTGADRDHTGLLGYSDGGTVFFDEIGELPLFLQAKLLRVIQERRFMPVGADREVAIDIRIISATNRDLTEEIQANRFREDLFYRLNVVPIPLPPLRERGGDILALALHFLDEFAEQFPDVNGLAPEAADFIQTYPWPGNVRELRNAIERALSLTTSNSIRLADLPEVVRDSDAIPPRQPDGAAGPSRRPPNLPGQHGARISDPPADHIPRQRQPGRQPRRRLPQNILQNGQRRRNRPQGLSRRLTPENSCQLPVASCRLPVASFSRSIARWR